MIRMTLSSGDTYRHKEEIKSKGFRWNGTHACWQKWYDKDDDPEITTLQNRFTFLGIKVLVEMVDSKPKEKKYPVKESWIFNLESMHDKIWCLVYDIREGKITCPFKVAGKVINDEDDLFVLMDEVDTLTQKAWRPVDGKTYGRIKEVVNWRVEQRYVACLNSGMSENEAGKCFEDV